MQRRGEIEETAPPSPVRRERRVCAGGAVSSVPHTIDISCPRCAIACTDECPQCRGEHVVRVELEPDELSESISQYAIERVEDALRSLLRRERVVGAEYWARRFASALRVPPPRDAAERIAGFLGVSFELGERVLHVASGALLEHARVIEAQHRYSRERLPRARAEAAALRALAKRIDPEATW
jgi:hypothetical protein